MAQKGKGIMKEDSGAVSAAGGGKKRLIGAVAPLGALRGKGSLGVGEFPDLAEFARFCKKTGVGLIQLLPVNDTGYFSAPYFALTAFALHPLYLRIEDLEEYGNAGEAVRKKIAEAGSAFEQESRFPYYRILKTKMEILRSLYDAHREEIIKKAAPGGALAAWIERNPWVKEYAVYRRLKEANGEKSWKEWENHREVAASDIETLWNDRELRGEHVFWAWLQEALDGQFGRAAKAVADEGILLEGDIPILMNEDSCDVWAHREYFRLDLSAGAPPDMYSPEGQNWGFPLHDWQAQSKDDYTWWRSRLKVAEKYYGAYRIDHVLGFFRIWASSRQDNTSALGRYIPYVPVREKDLAELGFDKGRIRWVSRPHVPTGEVWDGLRGIRDGFGMDTNAIAPEAERIFSEALERIGQEELWLFRDTIRGERDIDAMNFHPVARDFLYKAWHNRLFVEYEPGRYFPAWYFRKSRAYASLSADEQARLEEMLEKHRIDSEKIWETGGKKLLSELAASSS
ncbi:MAG: 4-alpha-glucanotransferase, partial [Treponema sp.]|nr:4-alpha-glucanotransferase [Treponema sp.]